MLFNSCSILVVSYFRTSCFGIADGQCLDREPSYLHMISQLQVSAKDYKHTLVPIHN